MQPWQLCFPYVIFYTWHDSLRPLSFTKLPFTAELTPLPVSQYHSLISQSSSLNPRPLNRLLPQRHTNANTHSYTPSHAGLPTHCSVMDSVSSLPRLTCRLHFATLCLHSNHSNSTSSQSVCPWGRKRTCWRTNQKSKPKGWELVWVPWPWPCSTGFKWKTKLTRVHSTSCRLTTTSQM